MLPALAAPPGDGTLELAPSAGVCVLKNGQAISGNVTRAGDYLIVTRGTQSELRLAVKDVEFVSTDLDEAYRRKSAALPKEKLEPHLDLAEWCLRNDMPAQATQEWLMALRLDAEHPRVVAFEQRLRFYAERTTKPESSHSSTPALSPDDLDKFTRELPKGVVEKFAATVQPILLNRCATGGCHGPSSQAELKLFRPAQGLVANRRFTQRNLYAVLQQIDRENAERSPLLVKPQERHGGGAGPVFDKQSQLQLEQLANWVRQAVVQPSAVQPASIRPGAESLSQPAKASPTEEPAALDASIKERDAKPPVEHEPESKGSASRPFVPRDPFDAEQFNRLYHAQP